jgi:hypothetical protein
MDVIIEAYNRNLLRLEDNRSYVLGMQKKGSAREGKSLLQDIVWKSDTITNNQRKNLVRFLIEPRSCIKKMAKGLKTPVSIELTVSQRYIRGINQW